MIYSTLSSVAMIDHEFKQFALSGYEYRTEREKQFELKRTVIDVRINFEKKCIEGKVELDLKLNSLPQDHLEIDATDMEVFNVSVSGKPVQFDSFSERIVIYNDFKAFANYILTITYRSYPKRGGYFVEDEGGLQFWTQGQDTDNHAWFPCFDYPNTRSAYEIRVTVPPDYKVISNGTLVNKIKGEFATYVYNEEFTFPSYLVSIIAGKFEELKYEWKGIPIYSYFLPKFSKLAERSFKRTPEMMDFISEKTGVKYPYKKYSQTCVTDFVFGGMENISATTLTDRTLHDNIAHLDYQSESLVCHELAHQWFGDYVTCKDWAHAWLNEGFATYIALIYTEKFKGKDEFLFKVQNHRDIYLEEFTGEYARPIVEKFYRDPIELFDTHLYRKASLFLRYLNYFLGDKIFWEGVKYYLEQNAMSGVSTEEFRAALTHVSGYSLDTIFHQFIYEPGHPEFIITESSSSRKVNVEIRQKNRVYGLRIPIRVYFEDRVEDDEVTIDREVLTLDFDKKGFRGFSFDPESQLLRTVEYSRSREEARYILMNGRSVLERADAAEELSKFGISEIDFYLKAEVEEEFWYVKGKIAKGIAEIGGQRAATAILKLLDEKDYLARREIVKASESFQDERLLKKLEKMFKKEKGYYIRAAEIISAERNGRELSKNLLTGALNVKSYDDVIRIAAVKAIGDLADRSLLDNIEKFYDKKHKWQTRAAVVRSVAKMYWKDRSIEKFLFDALKDSFFTVRLSAVEGISETGDKNLISRLSSALPKETDALVRRAIRKALESSGKIPSQEVETLRREVQKLKKKVSNLEDLRKTRK